MSQISSVPPLDRLFRPCAVAVIGASNNPLSIGHMVLRNLAQYQFQGAIFPIHPTASSIAGHTAYPSILEVPGEVDLVNICVHYRRIPQVIEECGKKGVKFVIVHTAGFKEVGDEGLRREQELVAIARQYGMRVFGPNSQGIQNSDPVVSVYANFTFVPMAPGNISIITQGGGMGELLKLHLYQAGLGHRLYCSYGNESDLTMPEILAYYGEDPGTRVIMLQIESFKNPDAFLQIARHITQHKPILALKAGRTQAGSRAVSSHTGMLVNQGTMAQAIFRKAGIVGFNDSSSMIQAAIAFSCQPPPRGRRLAIITNTGSPAIQAVDEAIEQGLTLAHWSEESRQTLQAQLLPEASLDNPLDVIATAGPEHYFAAINTLLGDEGSDMLLVQFVTAPFVDALKIAQQIRRAAVNQTKPLVVAIITDEKGAEVIQTLRQANIPVYPFAEEAVRSLVAMARYDESRHGCIEEVAQNLAIDHPVVDNIFSYLGDHATILPQGQAFRLLQAYGIRVPHWAIVADHRDLEPAAQQVGFPCVLKVDSPQVIHKSSARGVITNLHDLSSLVAAWEEMKDRFQASPATYLLQQQVTAGQELIIGAMAGEQLGPIMMFGLGGVLTEIIKDVAFSIAPLTHCEARQLMRDIKSYPLLLGHSPVEAIDLDALEDLLVRVSRLVNDWPQIIEIDLNPIIAYPRGVEPPVAVDVRIRLEY